MKLEDFLTKYRQRLENKRCLYVIKPNNPENVQKFGIAGFSESKNDAYARMRQYITLYGLNQKHNNCSGVMIYYLEYTKITPNVPKLKSKIYKKERSLINSLKEYRAPRRGLERIKTSWRNIDRTLDSKPYNDIEDEDVLPRRSQRIK